jgi:hypothetical protein
MRIASVGMVLTLGVCLAALLAACEFEEPELTPTPTPSEVTEAALRETVITYERALARLDLETAYALESAEFRQACPFERYEEMIAPLWPGFLSDCGFDETSEIGFVIESVEMGENWGAVYGCHESEPGRECCYPDYKLWDYKDGRWVLTSTVPCAYAQENERLLATLPLLPGAQQVSAESSFYSTVYEGIPDRQSLRVTYQAPPDKGAQDVIDFYIQSLGADWQHIIEEYPWEKGSILTGSFTRGTAAVRVQMFGGGPDTFDVSVDHRGAKPTPVPLEPAERAERDARVREILLDSKVGEALLAGREEGRDYWVVDIAHLEALLHGERAARVTIAFAESVSYEGEIPTVSDACNGTRGEYVPDDPCHDAPWVYGTKYASFPDVRDFYFTVEIDRGELIEMFSAGSPADIVDDMIEQAKSAEQQ